MRAFAPGSVTGIFAPPAPDSTSSQSRGASFATTDGVIADVQPADTVVVRIDGEPTDVAPVSGVIDRLGVTAAVDLSLAIPIGAGFGASGAATLSTALAANATFDLAHSRATLLDMAHAAEVAAGTGLGDVFVQASGGLRWSVGPDGRSHAVAPADRVEYATFGPIATADVLDDQARMERIRTVGVRALDRLPTQPTMREFIACSWAFARDTGLVTDRVHEVVERIQDGGGVGSMAMLGETVFAVGADGLLPNATWVDPDGARLLTDPENAD